MTARRFRTFVYPDLISIVLDSEAVECSASIAISTGFACSKQPNEKTIAALRVVARLRAEKSCHPPPSSIASEYVPRVPSVHMPTVSAQVGADGRVLAAVLYPSIRELWPEMHSTKNVRVVEVWHLLAQRTMVTLVLPAVCPQG